MMPRPVTAFVAALVAYAISGQAPVSPFNGLPIQPLDSTGTYRFLVSGHFYGGNAARSGFMASTLLANIDTINASGATFFLTTGDLFIDAAADQPRARRSFFSRLRMPLFNAVGNHDMDGGRYPALYGATFLAFDHGRDRFVVLNTEINDGSILGDQLDLLKQAVDDAVAGRVLRLFIVSHRPVWAEGNERYDGLFRGNTRSVMIVNYEQEVLPLLRKAAVHAPVFWISGSLGGQANASFFFDRPEQNLTYVQTAIRDEMRDALLLVEVTPSSVAWKGISLTGARLHPVETYDLAWWREHGGSVQGFQWKLLPYFIKSTVTHRAFWLGAVVALVLVVITRRILRRAA